MAEQTKKKLNYLFWKSWIEPTNERKKWKRKQ